MWLVAYHIGQLMSKTFSFSGIGSIAVLDSSGACTIQQLYTSITKDERIHFSYYPSKAREEVQLT